MNGAGQAEDGRRQSIERGLRAYRAPDEGGALKRAAPVIASALRARESSPRSTPRHRVVIALGLLATLLALSPAGASVRELIDDAFSGGGPARPALTRLPADGRLLVSSPRGGSWIVSEDGSRRRLGPYGEASWSPAGLFVAAARGRQLVAVDPSGEVRWSISRPDEITDPVWAPSPGYRIAYRSGPELRVVGGDGVGDHLLASGVSRVMPAWTPRADPGRNALAYVDDAGQIVVRNPDSGRVLWEFDAGEPVRQLVWIADGRVLAATATAVIVLSEKGREQLRLPQPVGSTISMIAADPAAVRVAIIRHPNLTAGGGSELILARIEREHVRQRRLFSAPGSFSEVVFSPDSEWLLLGWRDADQWLFIHPREKSKLLEEVQAVGDIARQFDPGGSPPLRFPAIEGWCCAG